MILQLTQVGISVRPLYVLLVLGCAGGGLFYVGLRLGLSPVVCVWSIMVADIILEAALVHYSGGLSSQFSLIFCVTIIAAAFLLQVHGGLGIALLASFVYASYGVLQAVGWLNPPVQTSTGVQALSTNLLHAYMHVSLFFIVGAVGGYLAQRTGRSGQQLEKAQTEIERLKVDTNKILDNMSSGILVIDSKGKIVTVNPTAEQILGVDKRDVLGLDVEAAFDPLMPEFAREMIQALDAETSKQRHEILIGRPDGRDIPLGLCFSMLKVEYGRKRGVIAVFLDLTEARWMRVRIRKADRLA
ncbi:MAG: PAS domain S-box protein, partial [bacterium]